MPHTKTHQGPRHPRTGRAPARSLVGVCLWAAAVSGCTTPERGPLTSFPEPHKGDGGIVIAQSSMVPNVTLAGSPGATSDCDGPALGIDVSGSTAADKFVFDASGNPCAAATLLYDGASMSGQRAADPTVNLSFLDTLGAIPGMSENAKYAETNRRARKAAPLAALPLAEVNSSLMQQMEQLSPANGDPLLRTLQNWRSADGVTTQRTAEADVAANRQLARLVRQAENNASSSAATQLAAQLRERERQLEEERRRHQESLSRAEQNRTQTTAAHDEWQQEENRLTSELAAAKARAAQFEDLAGRLKADQARKERAYQERIGALSNNLNVAEAQADVSRRQLILQAAAKVAEAQSLATAAHLENQQAQLAEAARLHAEANQLMDKVIVARTTLPPEDAAAPAPAVPMALNDVPVALQVKERTLPDILAEVLQQAAPQAGAWRADWQLSPQGQPRLKEKWSLTAEATVGEVLATLQKQLAQAGFTVQFNTFPQTRVLVITDQKP